ncbi:macro domain-like protein [Trametes coccinea BRFM310]|uniref:Macro domain-like protein n=1 Tax=Trametes coccinea (strain BRFM310) TaxID=1353009 RepID=A0A1Y2IDF8_TRAC3|nr:macro domain-like protein [Trametes coccinea BRFM310]
MDRPLDVNRTPRKLPEPDTSLLPSFVLIAPPPRTNPRTNLKVTAPSLCAAWLEALADLPASVAQQFAVKETRLDPAALAQEFGTFECVVSPANAFGIMDGGYDLALSRAFAVDGDIWALTNTVQDVLQDRHRGYLPPGCCELAPLPSALTASNPLGCTVLAVVPTMRTPEDVSWHRDLVYECMWNLLSAIWRWNKGERPEGAKPVKRVLMTGLGTGNGGIGYEKCAKQMCLAALNFARGWGERPRWDDVVDRAKEMDGTREL